MPCLCKKLEPDAGPSRLASLLPPVVTQSLSPVGNEGEGVVPGAARLVSQTAQRVHAIGQSQKNDQHLLRVQALLSGRKAKGLTSGRPWTLSFGPHYPLLICFSFSTKPAYYWASKMMAQWVKAPAG